MKNNSEEKYLQYQVDNDTLYKWLKNPKEYAFSLMKILPDELRYEFTKVTASEYPISRQSAIRCSVNSALVMYCEKCKRDEFEIEPYFNNMLIFGRKLVKIIDQILMDYNNDLITKEAADEMMLMEIQNLGKIVKQLEQKTEDIKPILNRNLVTEYKQFNSFVSELHKGSSHQMEFRELLARVQKSIDKLLGCPLFELSVVDPPLKTILPPSEKKTTEWIQVESTEFGYSIKEEVLEEDVSYKFEHDNEIYEIKKTIDNQIEIMEREQ